MKRRAFLRTGAAAAVAGTAVSAPAFAQSAPEVRWRMISSFPKSLETIFGTAQTISGFIAEATDNRFQVQVYAAGELAPSHQALDAVAGGAVECAHTPLYHYAGKDATLGVASGLPFGLNARHQQSWWSFGGGEEIINAALRQFNVYGFPAGTTGAQMGAWFKREITSLDDLKGIKIRVSGLGFPILGLVGAVPVRIARADVYAALANGSIDAAEFICPHDDERLGLVRVARFNHYPCWWEASGMVHFLVNLDKWTALPRMYQVIAGACVRSLRGVLALQIRLGQSARAQAAGGVWRGAQAVPGAGAGSLLQGHAGALWRAGCQGPQLQARLRLRQHLPP